MILSRRLTQSRTLLAGAVLTLALGACFGKNRSVPDAPESTPGPGAGPESGATPIRRGAALPEGLQAEVVITPGPTAEVDAGGPTEVPLDEQPLPAPQTRQSTRASASTISPCSRA